MEFPVYLFTGFLESGKTTLIKETLQDPDFHNHQKGVVICCEEGIEDYDDIENIQIVTVDRLEQFTMDFYKQVEETYHPDFVMIEFNGTWNVTIYLDMDMPENWIIVQILSLVDASTFNLYVQNMAQMIFDQLNESQVIIFNRCDENTSKRFIRTNIKTINKEAQLIYEDKNGNIIELSEEDLPFHMEDDPLVINDDDYGLWYLDVVDHPEKYDEKRVTIRGTAISAIAADDNAIILGRYAIVCCAEDARLIGVVALHIDRHSFNQYDWIEATGKIHTQYDELNDEQIIIMETESYKVIDPLEDGYVYFS